MKNKRISYFFLFLFLYSQLFIPIQTYALTISTIQPESVGFMPSNQTEMVDPFSGDFNYNIPLMDVEGYPINLYYNAGIHVDQEASWVGLGWNINPGVISRSMRGLPDDFSGELVKREFSLAPNITSGSRYSFGGSATVGFFSGAIDYSSGQFTSSTYGPGFESFVSASAGATLSLSTDLIFMAFGAPPPPASAFVGASVGGNVGIGFNTHEGALLNFSLTRTFFYGAAGGYGNQNASAGAKVQRNHTKSAGLSLSSSSGLKNLCLTYSTGISIGVSGSVGKNDVSGSVGMGFSNTKSGSIPIGTVSYTPAPTTGFRNKSFSFTDQNPSMTPIVEFYSNQTHYGAISKAMNSVVESPAFGYFYDYKGLLNKEALLDYNVERAGPPIETNPYLSPSNQTFDFYNISAHGYNSIFRPNKNYVGISGPTPVVSITSSNSKYIEEAIGLTGYRDINSTGFSIGINLSERWLNSSGSSGSLTQLQDQLTTSFFGGFNNNLHDYQKVDFHNNGSKVPVDQSFHNYLSDQDVIAIAMFPDITPFSKKSVLLNKYYKYYGAGLQQSQINTIPTTIPGAGRQVEGESFLPLTIDEAKTFGLQKKIELYGVNDFHVGGNGNMGYQSLLDRDQIVTSANIKSSQFSEITCSSSDGSRYVYGIPNYIKEQVELNFSTSIDGTPPNIDTYNGLIDYTTSEVDINNSNHRGIMKMVDKKTLPAYASSYQLTAILSSDFVDITNNGPTSDDLGTYTKFNYSKLPDYNFRSPVGEHALQARYSKGYNLDKEDEIGSIFYGTRERWYLHSIESKNFVACFQLNEPNDHPRVDARGVDNGINGDLQNNDVRYLEKIHLYAKKELLTNSNPVPIKTVHLVQSFTLCQDVPNNNSPMSNSHGKLTLLALAFTGGASERGKKYPYAFVYGNNPDYGGKNFDRWGCYDETGPGTNDNEDFPYTNQNSSTTNSNAAAWNLTEIHLPGGGEININYESDDYAYVQDQKAALMYPVLGLLPFNSPPGTVAPDNNLYDNSNPVPLNFSHQYLAIDLSSRPIPATYPGGMSFSSNDPVLMKKEYFQKKYLESCKITNTAGTEYRLYFRFSIQIDPSKNEFDFVPGYASFSPEFTQFDSNGEVAYLRINNVNIYDDENGISEIQNSSNFNLLNSLLNIVPINNSVEYISPFTKAAWQMTKKDLRHKVFNYNDPLPGNTANVPSIFAVKTLFKKTLEYLNGEFLIFRKNGIAKTMAPSASMVRLNDPSGDKLGGGYRVKSIVTKDNWTFGTEATYEQEYSYKTTNEYNEIISSGVATNEPFSGSEENVLHKPLNFYTDKVIFAPNNEYYFEGPIGESMYPNPSVGYSKITVTQKVPTNSRSKTGKVIYEYYTAKDFPVYAKSSTKIKNIRKPTEYEIKSQGLTSSGMYESQGFALFLNDMHGKPKSIFTCEEGKSESEAVSGVRYTYLTSDQNNKILGESVLCTEDGLHVYYKKLATELDVSINANERIDNSVNINNTSTEAFGIIAADLSSDVSVTTAEYAYGSVTCTKVISRFGILTKTETWNNYENSKTIAENIVWDEQTGEVVLQRVSNPYGNHNQLLNIPAYWIYKGMGVAKQNLGMLLPITFAANQPIQIPSTNTYLTPGDEVALLNEDSPFTYSVFNGINDRLWVAKSADNTYNGDFVLIDRNGYLFESSVASGSDAKLKIIRSGFRNNLEDKAGNIVSHTNQSGMFPDNTNTDKGFLLKPNGSNYKIDLSENDRILDANAAEYSDWRLLLGQLKSGSINCVQNELSKDLCDLFNAMIAQEQISPYTGTCLELTQAPFAKYFNNPYNHYRTIKSVVEESSSSLHNQLFGKINWDAVWSQGAPQNPTGCKIAIYTSNSCQGNPICTITLFVQVVPPVITNPIFPDLTTYRKVFFDPNNCSFTADDYSNNQYFDLSFGFSPYVSTFKLMKEGCYGDLIQTCNQTEQANPYVTGMAGNYYQSKNYSFISTRENTSNLPVKEKGYYNDYTSFWKNTSDWKSVYDNDEVLGRWVLKSEISQMDNLGNVLEAKNRSANFTATKYGYNSELPITNISNARNEQVLSFNFEIDPSSENSCFPILYSQNRDDYGIAHTGKYAMKINQSGETEMPDLFNLTEEFSIWKDYLTKDERKTEIIIPYAYKQKHIVTTFTPGSSFVKGEQYVVSAWFYQSKSNSEMHIPRTSSGQIPIEFDLKLDGTTLNPVSVTTSKIIDGWQKVDAVYKFTGWETKCKMQIGVHITNTQNVASIFMDDFRIFPFNASISTKVYHPIDRKLMAELDENNFATFYVYGDNGELIGTKKETKDGILSISEKRTGTYKH